MSSNDGPANPTESAEVTPEQLQMRLAQAQAEAEAARLQVEVLKLQAQLAATKDDTPATEQKATSNNTGPAAEPKQSDSGKSSQATRKPEAAAEPVSSQAAASKTVSPKPAEPKKSAEKQAPSPKKKPTPGQSTQSTSAERWKGVPTPPAPKPTAKKAVQPQETPAKAASPAPPEPRQTTTKATSKSAAVDEAKSKSATPARHQETPQNKESTRSRGPEEKTKSPPPLPAGKDGESRDRQEETGASAPTKAAAGTTAAGAAAASTNGSAKLVSDEPAATSPDAVTSSPIPAQPASAVSSAAATVATAPAAVMTVPVTPPIEATPVPAPSPPAGAELQAEPTDDSVVEGAENEDEWEEDEDRRGWATLMLAVPSWLVSLLFHTAVLLAAALFSFSVEDEAPKRILIANAAEEEEEVLEEVVIEEQMDLQEVEMNTIPTPDINPGAIDFGDLGGADIPASNVSIGLDTTDVQMVEIGALFGTGGKGMAAHGDGMSGTFFNVKATGSRFAFVVDSSLSMKSGKFDAACEELLYAASRLNEEQAFYVVFFDWDAARMFDQDNPEPRMVRATPQNLQRLKYWMDSVELELKTNPYDAMEFAMKLMPDAIYVLSDGAFTDGGRTVKWLKEENLVEDDLDGTKPVVTIHTIGFYTEDNGTLKQMAETYGGTYRFVPKPPNAPKRGAPRRRP